MECFLQPSNLDEIKDKLAKMGLEEMRGSEARHLECRGVIVKVKE